MNGTKVCNTCKTEKPLSEFYAKKRPTKIGYSHQCKACHSAYCKQYSANNRDKRNEYQRAYYKKSPHIFKAIIKKWRTKNKERVAAHHSKWRKEVYLPREVELRTARYAATFGAKGFHTTKDFEKLLQQYNGTCAYCGEKPATTRDHIIPLSRGGSNYIGNILPACMGCNCSKSNKLLSEWRRMPNTRFKRWCF